MDAQQSKFLMLLDFYFKNEVKINCMMVDGGPDNAAYTFVRYLKNHAATRSLKTIGTTSYIKAILQKQMGAEVEKND